MFSLFAGKFFVKTRKLLDALNAFIDPEVASERRSF